MGDVAGCMRHLLVRGVCMDLRGMTAPQTVADVQGRCDCRECSEDEAFREAESILEAQMLEHGFPLRAAATSARQGETK